MIPIETKEDYLKFLAGRKALYENGWSNFFPNGTWHATYKGKKISGTWRWEDRYLCRKGTIDCKPMLENCIAFSRSKDGKEIISTRDKGKGRVTHSRLVDD